MIKEVVVNSQFDAIHCWPESPPQTIFLRHPHRHIFKVRLGVEVTEDREVEFFKLKMDLDLTLNKYRGKDIGRTSCERIAEELIEILGGRYQVVRVEVFEDGENGVIFKKGH